MPDWKASLTALACAGNGPITIDEGLGLSARDFVTD
jgi:hypothetical protein